MVNNMNLQQVGRKISELRKERDITQNELAEKAGVSYQAVSSWERGLTMPDIAKLPGISQILGVSIDQLLGNENEVRLVKNILNNNTLVYAKEEELHIDEIEEVAHILKPSQVEDLVQHVEPETIKLSDIKGLAPFISRNTLDKLVLKVGDIGTLEEIRHIAPFVSRGILDQLVLKAEPTSKLAELRHIAPFVSRETLDQLVRKTEPASKLAELRHIAPFISRAALDDLALNVGSVENFEELTHLAPFLSRKVLDELISKTKAPNTLDKLKRLAPHASRDVIDKLVSDIVGKMVE